MFARNVSMRLNTHGINARRLAVSVLGAALVAAPLLRSEDVKPSETKVIVIKRLAVQELGLQSRRDFEGWLQAAPVSVPAMSTPNLLVIGIFSLEKHCRHSRNRWGWNLLMPS